jgi:hypothetical protein
MLSNKTSISSLSKKYTDISEIEPQTVRNFRKGSPLPLIHQDRSGYSWSLPLLRENRTSRCSLVATALNNSPPANAVEQISRTPTSTHSSKLNSPVKKVLHLNLSDTPCLVLTRSTICLVLPLQIHSNGFVGFFNPPSSLAPLVWQTCPCIAYD